MATASPSLALATPSAGTAFIFMIIIRVRFHDQNMVIIGLIFMIVIGLIMGDMKENGDAPGRRKTGRREECG